MMIASCDLLYGVMGAPDLKELAYSSVEIVDFQDRDEIEWRAPQPKPSRLLVMVTFTSPIDLRIYARRHSFTMRADAWLCAEDWEGPTRRLSFDSSVFGGLEEIDFSNKKNLDGTWKYRMYLYTDPYPPDEIGLSPAILQDYPGNVCLRVSGGNMIGQTYKSNIMIVPRQAILDAFARAGLF